MFITRQLYLKELALLFWSLASSDCRADRQAGHPGKKHSLLSSSLRPSAGTVPSSSGRPFFLGLGTIHCFSTAPAFYSWVLRWCKVGWFAQGHSWLKTKQCWSLSSHVSWLSAQVVLLITRVSHVYALAPGRQQVTLGLGPILCPCLLLQLSWQKPRWPTWQTLLKITAAVSKLRS